MRLQAAAASFKYYGVVVSTAYIIYLMNKFTVSGGQYETYICPNITFSSTKKQKTKKKNVFPILKLVVYPFIQVPTTYLVGMCLGVYVVGTYSFIFTNESWMFNCRLTVQRDYCVVIYRDTLAKLEVCVCRLLLLKFLVLQEYVHAAIKHLTRET